jgi:hypothetical protein
MCIQNFLFLEKLWPLEKFVMHKVANASILQPKVRTYTKRSAFGLAIIKAAISIGCCQRLEKFVEMKRALTTLEVM